MSLAHNIRFFRKKQGWGQDALAEKLGYKSYTTIQKWESGVSEPPLKVVHALADLFHVSINDLTGTESSSPATPEYDEGEKALIDLYRRLPEHQKDHVLELIKAALGLSK